MEGQYAIKMKDDIMMLIKQMEVEILAQWSEDATNIIHGSTSKYLLIKTAKGLIAPNFDENVSFLPSSHMYNIKLFVIMELGFSTLYTTKISLNHSVIKHNEY